MRKSFVLLAVTACLFIGANSVSATIFSNFGSGGSFNASSGYVINQDFEQGFQFLVSGGSFEVESIKLAAANFSPILLHNSDPVDLFINLTMDRGDYPGLVIETFHFVLSGSTVASLVLSSDSLINPVLTGGKYWLTGNSPGYIIWRENNLDPLDRGWHWMKTSYQDGVDSNIRGVFAVEGVSVANSVPEPSSILLLGAGLIGLLGLRRKE